MIQIEEKNSNYYVSIDGRKPQSFSSKNHLMRYIAEIIGVSILTSDEVSGKEDIEKNIKVEIELHVAQKILEQLKRECRGCLPAKLSPIACTMCTCTILGLEVRKSENRLFEKKLDNIEKSLDDTENKDWDTEPISHDGIQFNKHFIELKEKIGKIESGGEYIAKTFAFFTGKIAELETKINELSQK